MALNLSPLYHTPCDANFAEMLNRYKDNFRFVLSQIICNKRIVKVSLMYVAFRGLWMKYDFLGSLMGRDTVVFDIEIIL